MIVLNYGREREREREGERKRERERERGRGEILNGKGDNAYNKRH